MLCKVAVGPEDNLSCLTESLRLLSLLQNVRVVQRNLVYVVGLALELCYEDLLKTDKYFGQFGKIIKVSRPLVTSPPRLALAGHAMLSSVSSSVTTTADLFTQQLMSAFLHARSPATARGNALLWE